MSKKTHTKKLEKRFSRLRDESKQCEAHLNSTLDMYSDLARALGFKGQGFWNDPGETHADIVKRARRLVEFAGQHGWRD